MKRAVFICGQPGAGKTTYGISVAAGDCDFLDPDDFIDHCADRKKTEEIVSAKISADMNDEKSFALCSTIPPVDYILENQSKLIENGYSIDVIIITVNAIESWKSLIDRAHKRIAAGQKPMVPPIRLYGKALLRLADAVELLERKTDRSRISIVLKDRNGRTIRHNGSCAETVRKATDPDSWEFAMSRFEAEFNSMVKEYLWQRLS